MKYKGDEGVTGTENATLRCSSRTLMANGGRSILCTKNGKWVPEKSELFMNVLELRDGTELLTFPRSAKESRQLWSER